MEDNRTSQHDGSERYSKKAATSDSVDLLTDPRARAGFAGLFGDRTIDLEGVVSKPTFFGRTHIRDLDGDDEAYITGDAVDLAEVA